MSDFEDNISDFDEEEDDPDHMAIPGALPITKQNTGGPSSSMWPQGSTDAARRPVTLATLPQQQAGGAVKLQPIRAMQHIGLLRSAGARTTVPLPAVSAARQTALPLRVVGPLSSSPRFQLIKSSVTNRGVQMVTQPRTAIGNTPNSITAAGPPLIDLTDNTATPTVAANTRLPTDASSNNTSLGIGTVGGKLVCRVPPIHGTSSVSPALSIGSGPQFPGGGKVYRIVAPAPPGVRSVTPLTSTVRGVTPHKGTIHRFTPMRHTAPLLLSNSLNTGGIRAVTPLHQSSVRCITPLNAATPSTAISSITPILPSARLVTRTHSPILLAKAAIKPTTLFKRLPDGKLIKVQPQPGPKSIAVTGVVRTPPATPVPSALPPATTPTTDGDLLSAALFSSGLLDIGGGGDGGVSSSGSSSGGGGGLQGITVTIPGMGAAPATSGTGPSGSGRPKTIVTVCAGRTMVTTGPQVGTVAPSTGTVAPSTGPPRSFSPSLLLPRPGPITGVGRGSIGQAAVYNSSSSPLFRMSSNGTIGGALVRAPLGMYSKAGGGLMPSTSTGGALTGLAGLVALQHNQLDEMEEDDGAMRVADTFQIYRPSKLKIGLPHPDSVVESASMASVAPPDVVHQLRLPQDAIFNCKLSGLQLETITYVGQKHDRFLPDNYRAGFLVGDGAGVGKGRTIAGIIFDNYLRGRKKSIWVSASNDLKYDAERDLQDIGASNIKVRFLSKMKYAKIYSEENGNMKKGVIFATYAALIGECSSAASKYGTRMKQLLDWCGPDFDGCIIFDECHKAKNLNHMDPNDKSSSKTGKTVFNLQKKLPRARVVYASATGASEPKNMAYMNRLGLWGLGTPFKSFADFIDTVDKRGVGAMEIVAMDMKLRGMYIARQLGFYGVTFRIEEAPLTVEFKKMYDDAVMLWVRARESFQDAANLLTAESNVKKSMWGQFWSAHQRFFKYLCIASKVEMAVCLSRDAIKCSRCVVIGLQSTGEARTQEEVEKGEGELTDFVSTAKGVLETLIDKHFPASNAERVNRILALARRKTEAASTKRKKNQSHKNKSKKQRMNDHLMTSDEGSSGSDDSDNSFDEDTIDSMCSKFLSTPSTVAMFNRENDKYSSPSSPASRAASPGGQQPKAPLTSQESIKRARELKERLLRQVHGLGKRMPANTLDQLIDELGGPDNVAEMTGRKGRVVQNDFGRIEHRMRTDGDVAQEMLNLTEKERFMNGEKLVAIISEAASSGISLQSDRRVKNQRRRVHITLELPWSADRAIQQFGRTHRSNQVNAPEYVFLISELAGERRFASIVAKRLESMGALTHGDRRTADTRDLSSFNIDNQYGRDALQRTMNTIMNIEWRDVELPTLYTGDFMTDIKPALVGCGLATKDARDNYCLEKDATNMTKFLNRILGMPVDLQNALFQYFTDTLTAITTQAKKAGRFDKGILDLCVGDDGCKSQQLFTWNCEHSTGKASTTLYRLQVLRGMTWQQAIEKAHMLLKAGEGFYLSKRLRKSRKAALLAVLDNSQVNEKRPKADKLYTVYRPNLGRVGKQERYADLRKNYESTELNDVRDHWEEQYKAFERTCAHIVWTGNCDKIKAGHKCEYGLRTRTYHVLCGSVLNVWGKVEDVLASDPQNPRFYRLQVVRFRTDKTLKHVGTLIPNNMVKKVCEMLDAQGREEERAGVGVVVDDYATAGDYEDDDDIVMLTT